MKILIVLCCAIVLTGCTTNILTHEGRVTYADLAKSMPRTPIRIAYSSAYPDNRRSQGIMATLKRHPMVQPAERGAADVIVNFDTVECSENWVIADGPLLAILSPVLVPIMLVGNPFPSADSDCAMKMTYSLTSTPGGSSNKSFGYRYNFKSQNQLLLYPLYSSPAREAYQEEYLYDQVVARFLLEVEKELRADVR